ncbi:phosphotransferase [Trueperella sp. LYQ141]|uniref:phosphotransferase n=1 Tax=Trueperella sp. LYQ141 TaxID=3391058 RepID=UPI003983C0C0
MSSGLSNTSADETRVRAACVQYMCSQAMRDLLELACAAFGVQLAQFSWDKPHMRPGAGISVGYTISDRQGKEHYIVASTERISSTYVQDNSETCYQIADPPSPFISPVTLWLFPHDPLLPALSRAVDDQYIADVLGLPGLTSRVVVYRPTRRAVVKYHVHDRAYAYGKVVQKRHAQALIRRVDVMTSGEIDTAILAFAASDGLIVTRSLSGYPLSHDIAYRPDVACERIGELERLLAAMPATIAEFDVYPSWSKRITQYARNARAYMPEWATAIDVIADSVSRHVDTVCAPSVPTHGDFFEANVFVQDDGRLAMIDLDHIGPGQRNDDWACLLAHVSVLPFLTENRWVVADPQEPYRDEVELLNPGGLRCSYYPQAERVLRSWCAYLEKRVDGRDLYLRAAAVTISIASNSDVAHAPREARARMRRAMWWYECARHGRVVPVTPECFIDIAPI